MARQARSGAPGAVLDRRALNRALLARQLLLERRAMPALDVVEHLVGIQSQSPDPPYFALWTRIAGFQPQDLSHLLSERRAVRIALMRSTIHLVSARDCLPLRSAMQPVVERMTVTAYRRQLAGLDLAEVAAAGRALVEAQPLTPAEIGERLRERWPDREGHALGMAVRALVPMVQVPPRGLWRAGGRSAHTSAESWLGGPPAPETPEAPEATLDDIVLRYLRAFGPASAADVRAWSGLTRLDATMERLRPRLVTFRDERGVELFDLPDAPRPGGDTPAPPRLLSEYDNVLLSYADRTRMMTTEYQQRVFGVNGFVASTVLVDGFVHGTWRLARERTAARLTITAFAPIPRAARAALKDEAERLLDFAAPETKSRAVTFTR